MPGDFGLAVRLDAHLLPSRVSQLQAGRAQGHFHLPRFRRVVAHQRGEAHLVTDHEKARRNGANEQGFGHQQFGRPLADQRILGQADAADGPCRQIIGHFDRDDGPAVRTGHDRRIPVGCIGELLAYGYARRRGGLQRARLHSWRRRRHRSARATHHKHAALAHILHQPSGLLHVLPILFHLLQQQTVERDGQARGRIHSQAASPIVRADNGLRFSWGKAQHCFVYHVKR